MAFKKLPTLTKQSQLFLTNEAVAHREMTLTDHEIFRMPTDKLAKIAYGKNGEPTTEPYFVTSGEKKDNERENGERVEHGISRAWILSEFRDVRHGKLDKDTRYRLFKHFSSLGELTPNS